MESTLVIMAAGRGSRFGGLKQISDADGRGHSIIDYSVYDAARVGFDRIVFIINRKIEPEFRKISDTYQQKYDISVDYAYQETDDLPDGFAAPHGRSKPFGTAHAVACLDGVVDSPFALINADDLYGRSALESVYGFLVSGEAVGYNFATVVYRLINTLSENGSVSRGICRIRDGYLTGIREHTGIIRTRRGIVCDDPDDKATLDECSPTSVNLWGFTPAIISECKYRFSSFLNTHLLNDPLGCEFYLPDVVSDLINEGKSQVRVLENGDFWHGITYCDDLIFLRAFLSGLAEKGDYPMDL